VACLVASSDRVDQDDQIRKEGAWYAGTKARMSMSKPKRPATVNRLAWALMNKNERIFIAAIETAVEKRIAESNDYAAIVCDS
jgi:hypothetical protein